MSSTLGNLVRLTPLQLNELPAHPSIAQSASDDQRPKLLSFLKAILDEGSSFLSKESLETTFNPASSKSSPPSTADVEVLKRDISAAAINDVSWETAPLPRQKPQLHQVGAEYWFARRSQHANVSSKEKQGSASWDEFVFGLRDDHSKHEFDFTPTLYDAHHILDWNDDIQVLERDGTLTEYSHITMSGEFTGPR